jgi:hypothetical protein
MRKIITAIALTTVMAAPAFARTATTHHTMAPSAERSEMLGSAPARAFEGSEYVGTDPDPRIRSELRRDEPDDR